MVKRGEVWVARLEPTEGREIRKSRPCLVVSPPEIHDHLDIVMVAPMTTGSRPAAYRIPVRFGGKSGLILLEQIRVLDKRRLTRRWGSVERDVLARVLTTLREMFAD
jgi:mRNA interferase MazF